MNDSLPQATGRPSIYDAASVDTVLERLSGGEALRAICRDENLPSESTFRRWVQEDREGLSARFARAWEARAERLAEEILEIADDGTGDEYQDENGVWRTNHDVVQRSKLRVQARQWLLSKVLPKQYGDASTLEITGGGNPLKMIVEYVDPPNADG